MLKLEWNRWIRKLKIFIVTWHCPCLIWWRLLLRDSQRLRRLSKMRKWQFLRLLLYQPKRQFKKHRMCKLINRSRQQSNLARRLNYQRRRPLQQLLKVNQIFWLNRLKSLKRLIFFLKEKSLFKPAKFKSLSLNSCHNLNCHHRLKPLQRLLRRQLMLHLMIQQLSW